LSPFSAIFKRPISPQSRYGELWADTGCGLGLDLSLPLTELNWMDAVRLGDLVDGPLGLELRRMNSSLF
jgi:hypothetical protein